MLNICDEGTGLQICIPLWKGAKAQEVREKYRKHWKRWAGNTRRVFTDGGTEFDGQPQEGFDHECPREKECCAQSVAERDLRETWRNLERSVRKGIHEVTTDLQISSA